MNIFITGANGTIGSSLVKSLADLDHNIFALVKDTTDDYNLKNIKGLKIIYCDIRNFSEISHYLKSIDIFIHLAAIVHKSNVYDDIYFEVNFNATKKIFEICKENYVNHFIFASTIALYGLSKKNKLFFEDSNILPTTPYSQSKFEAENYIKNNNGNLNFTILRLATVYGPDDKGNISKLFSLFKKGIFISFGNAKKSLLNVDNLNQSIIKILNNPAAYNKIFNVADLEYYTLQTIYKYFKQASLKNAIYIRIPDFIINILIFLNNFLKINIRFSLSLIDNLNKMNLNSIVSIDNLKTTIGYESIKKSNLQDGIQKYYLNNLLLLFWITYFLKIQIL
jgi:nucleoside-diphosphate-sugar epimerase